MNALFIFDLMIALIIVVVTLYLINPKIFEFYDEPCLDDPVIDKLKEQVQRFLDARTTPWTEHLEILNNKKKNVLKKMKLCKGTTGSYTLDKKTTYICVKDPVTDKYYADNMLMHVLLHEISHVICTEIGHTKTFDGIFQQLMKEAHEFGIYDKTLPLVTDYCGLTKADTYTV